MAVTEAVAEALADGDGDSHTLLFPTDTVTPPTPNDSSNSVAPFSTTRIDTSRSGPLCHIRTLAVTTVSNPTPSG